MDYYQIEDELTEFSEDELDKLNEKYVLDPWNRYWSCKVISTIRMTNCIMYIMKGGVVFNIGNGDFGQLGHGNTEAVDKPKLIEALKNKNVVSIVGGWHSNFFLTKKGEVYSCGYGGDSVLGHGNSNCQYIPKRIEALVGKKIIKIDCFDKTSLFLTSEGTVYKCGNYDEKPPALIEYFNNKQIIDFSIVDAYSLFLTKDHEVYVYGNNKFVNNGDTSKSHWNWEKTYTPIKAFKNIKIIKVIASPKYALFLSDKGEVYSSGDGRYLGHPDSKDLPIIKPKLIKALKGKKIVDIGAYRFEDSMVIDKFGSFFQTNYGETYICGGYKKAGFDSEDCPEYYLIPTEFTKSKIIFGHTVVKN